MFSRVYVSALLLGLWGCSENPGVIPTSGTDETAIDRDALAREQELEDQRKIDPNAEVLTLPKVDLSRHEEFPIQVQDFLPARKRGASIKLVGEISSHPSPTAVGAGVVVKFWPVEKGRDYTTHALSGGATAPEGQPASEWAYVLNGTYPREPGRYGVRIEVFTVRLGLDLKKLTAEELSDVTVRGATYNVAEGEVDVE